MENIGAVAERAISLIRFPTMNSEDFTLNVAVLKILDYDDVISILVHNMKPTKNIEYVAS
jgi:hypothetical protein